MNESLIVAILNVVAKIGIPATTALLEGLQKAPTLAEAIAALRAAASKTAEDYLAEARQRAGTER